jgi:KaiC/GvpD/RAD55 family RecA-like ATPase
MAIKFSELKEGETILFITSAQKYVSTNLEILKQYINNRKCYCVYITVNKPYAALMKLLQQEKIDTSKCFFIDAITPTSAGMQRAGNAVFIGNPKGLTNISIAAAGAVKSMPKGHRLLFLDSISTLILYNDTGSVTKFSHFLINKMKEWDCSGAIISLEKETDEKMISQLSQFVDRVVEVK